MKNNSKSIFKLTPAQQREYDKLSEHKSLYVAGLQRRNIFDRLVELGLAEKDGSWYWFHLKEK